MKVVTESEIGIEIPVWLEWFHDTTKYAFDEKSELTAYCSKTWLNVSVYIEISENKNRVVNITCDSKTNNWKCICPNWPRDDEWKLTFCDVIIDD